MDEGKTIDEAVEEQAIDEAVDKADEMKEFEPVAFDEVIKETEPERKDAPVLRALGDPEPADMTMIHKHMDNFLAMIVGETPVDSNVRNSTEYWLKRLADGLGGSTKKIYCHPITMVASNDYDRIAFFIFDTDPEPYTLERFLEWATEKQASIPDGILRIPTTGSYTFPGALGLKPVTTFTKSSSTDTMQLYTSGVGAYEELTYAQIRNKFGQYFYDGVNAIN